METRNDALKRLLLTTSVLIALASPAFAGMLEPWRQPGTPWNAVVEDYSLRGFEEHVVGDLHVWIADSGNMLLWNSKDERGFGYNCLPRYDSGAARCSEYNLATGAFVRRIIRPVPDILKGDVP
jgi:hypothetical protein